MEELNFRLADDADIDAINSFYNSVYKKNRDRVKFNWEYNSAPAGKAIYVVAEHQGRIVGTQCVIPYYLVTADNQTILTGKSEDTLVSPGYRGKSIFEKMYALLIEACKKNNITCIWGFTYAVKPFLKLGFSVPFRSKMGLMVFRPLAAQRYFASLSSKNTMLDKMKIRALCFGAWSRALMCKAVTAGFPELSSGAVSLNEPGFNYLNYKNSFGLKLDQAFVDYRITNNPYSQQYNTFSSIASGSLQLSVTYTITNENVGYIIHLYIKPGLAAKDLKSFLGAVIKQTPLKSCIALRFWGFTHNLQNQMEVELLKKAGFVFLNRGISLVWLTLDPSLRLKPEDFVLSRMASQGTD